jgi:hypothetical protein
MSNLMFDTEKRLAPALRAGDLEGCERAAGDVLRSLPESPFHLVLALPIANDPSDAARHFDRFFEYEAKRITIKAAYTEMNGFAINPDRWYCSLFAYEEDGGHSDYDWLADWQSEDFEDFEIDGLEPLQKVYASEAFGNEKHQDACGLCDLLVVIKFQRFMEQAAARMRRLEFPLYATAHDWEFIAAFQPSRTQRAN